jgi:hypothetical protein
MFRNDFLQLQKDGVDLSAEHPDVSALPAYL